jgi:hypothetical protein
MTYSTLLNVTEHVPKTWAKSGFGFEGPTSPHTSDADHPLARYYRQTTKKCLIQQYLVMQHMLAPPWSIILMRAYFIPMPEGSSPLKGTYLSIGNLF